MPVRVRKLSFRRAALTQHEPTHDRLLTVVGPAVNQAASPGLLHLVVIPTCRPFDVTTPAILRAAELAGAFGAVLLVLCSRDAHVEDFPAAEVEKLGTPTAVVEFSRPEWPSVLPSFGTAGHPLAALPFPHTRDTADKRNLGLLVAAASRWSGVLFLDDDVAPAPGESLDEGSLAAAMTFLRQDGIRGAGWVLRRTDATSIDDNSVVCHARRLAGYEQGCFLGGGAFAVRVGPSTPFFPKLYNEDWLFQYQLLRPVDGPHGRLAAFGSVRQEWYDPFVRRRAQIEEVGDVLGEGLYQVLGKGAKAEAQIYLAAYWRDVLADRASMIEQVRHRLDSRWDRRAVRHGMRRLPLVVQGKVVPPLIPAGTAHATQQAGRTSEVLGHALKVHSALPGGPEALAEAIPDYLRVWRADLRKWRKSMEKPPALALHGLLTDPNVTRLVGASAKEAFELVEAGASAPPRDPEPS